MVLGDQTMYANKIEAIAHRWALASYNKALGLNFEDFETIKNELRAEVETILAAMEGTRALVSEAAMTGFNCHDGDWAERLYANQAKLSAAIDKANGKDSRNL
jgi:hypothetical protein